MLILATQQFLLLVLIILQLSSMIYSLVAVGVVLVHCFLAELQHLLAILERLVIQIFVVRLLILLLMCWFLALFVAVKEVRRHGLGAAHFLLIRLLFLIVVAFDFKLVSHSVVDHPRRQLHTLRVLLSRSVVHIKHLLIHVVCVIVVIADIKRV